MSESGNKSWKMAEWENVWVRPDVRENFSKPIPLVVLLRVRNEELIIKDTLDHLAGFSDVICVYEDASTDKTREILKSHEKVHLIVENNEWQSGLDNRLLSETRHRGLLLQEARNKFSFNWCMCCDADERYFGAIRQFVMGPVSDKPESIRIQLFDAYMTVGDDRPCSPQVSLVNFRRKFGPERRDILMLWKNDDNVHFAGLDSREPIVQGRSGTEFFCQHYGKSLSYEHWEETCDYYISQFPYETYGKKWEARKGKGLHSVSDFGRPLFEWGDSLFENSVKIN